MDEPYSKREEDQWRLGIKTQLNRIETQTIKTNGRVNSLEGWKMYISGGLAVIVVLLIPILIFVATDYISALQNGNQTVNIKQNV